MDRRQPLEDESLELTGFQHGDALMATFCTYWGLPDVFCGGTRIGWFG